MWRPKQKAPCEASGEVPPGEVPPQFHLSCEDKGKLPIRFGSFAEAINREARLATLPSPNLGAVTPCANLVLPSEASMAWLTQCQYPRVRAKFSAPRLELKHSAVIITFEISPNPQALSPLFEAKLRDHPWVLIEVLMQLQHLRVLPELSTAKLKLKHYPVPIASAVMQRTRHRPVLRFQGLRMLSPPLQMEHKQKGDSKITCTYQ